ncbi:MAG: CHAT domain-containing protein, partial [Okeania sp. SIO2D1]|nr:CHAT domain-containing protein [Okeania sp. SIO2D1]
AFLNEEFTLKNLTKTRDATTEAFGIIHLATHAEFKPGKPSESYIQFWDEKISLDKLPSLGWDKPQVEMLVLSACRTAIGDTQAELGFAGSAAIAGVKSVLGSLWTVDDEGTLALMTSFYEKLATQELSVKAEALRLTQLAMLRGEVKIVNGKLVTSQNTVDLPPELAELQDKDLTHPYYWSGFTLIGNPW